MQPQLVVLPPLTLVGLEARFIGALYPGASQHKIVPPLREAFLARAAELGASEDGVTYGASRPVAPKAQSLDGEMLYLAGRAGLPHGTLPKGFKRWKVPTTRYAVFIHRGSMARLNETIDHIYDMWLPSSDFTQSDGVILERYGPGYDPKGDDSTLEYLLPIRRMECL